MDYSRNVLKGFICFEGLDGTGTTTQINKISTYTQNNGRTARNDFEPTASPLGKLCRNCLSGAYGASRGALARLFSADRHDHLYGKNGIIDAISHGNLVFCDRYLFSSLAYQGSDVAFEEVFELNRSFPLPQITFYFDIDPEKGLERVHSRGGEKDIYETLKYQNQVRDNYARIWELYKDSPMILVTIDASLSIEEVFAEVLASLQKYSII